MKKVSFKRIDQMTPSEWKLIESFETEEHRSMPSLVIDSLKSSLMVSSPIRLIVCSTPFSPLRGPFGMEQMKRWS